MSTHVFTFTLSDAQESDIIAEYAPKDKTPEALVSDLLEERLSQLSRSQSLDVYAEALKQNDPEAIALMEKLRSR